MGDQILKIISQRLKRRFTESVVFHLGADNFAILAGRDPLMMNLSKPSNHAYGTWVFAY